MAKNTSKGSGDKKNVWKGIQKRLSTAATKKPQDGEQVSTHTKVYKIILFFI
jgi:hypothetical protein